MKQKQVLLISFLSLIFFSVYSQESNGLSLGFEVGSGFVTGDLNKNWNVRQYMGNYDYDYSYGSSISSDMSISFIGIRPEISFLQNKIAVSSGLRYTRINSSLSNGSTSDGAFFYLRGNGNTTNIDYYKVRKINEDNDYIGIPLDIKFLPFLNEYFDLYFKLGAEINFRFNTSTDIDFLNPDMEQFQQELIANVKFTPNHFYSSLYGAIGIRLGKKDRVKYNLELILPTYILTANNSSLLTPRYYTGFNFTVQLPGKKSKSQNQNDLSGKKL